MNILLIFFAIPVATIILAGILETFVHCPLKIAGIFFSIFLVVAFALGGTVELLVGAIIYTIISFITAFIVMLFRNRQRNCNYRYNNDFRVNNEFNNYNSIPLGINEEDNVANTLVENDNTNFEFNNFNNNNCCRRYR